MDLFTVLSFCRSAALLVAGVLLLIYCIRNRYFSPWMSLVAFGSLGIVSSNSILFFGFFSPLITPAFPMNQIEMRLYCWALDSLGFIAVVFGVVFLVRDMDQKLIAWRELAGLESLGNPAFASVRQQLRTWSYRRGDGTGGLRPPQDR